jgi:hypothetical protein
MVYVLLLDAAYEGQSLLGVYSTLELAQEAGRSYDQDGFRDDVVVVTRELDGVGYESFSYVWQYRP